MVTPRTAYLVALIVLLLDQSSKILAKKFLTYTENTGAAFSILQGQNTPLAVIAGIVTLFLIIYLKNHPSFSLALLLGGTLGNLTDRIFLGSVIDFIDFRVWPSFNVADAANTIGVLLLLLKWKKHDQKR